MHFWPISKGKFLKAFLDMKDIKRNYLFYIIFT